MFLQRLLKPGPAKSAGERLYAATVAQARQTEIYAVMGAPDTPDGRFEVYTAHVVLVLERLRAEGRATAPLAQAYFDAYLSGLDHGLRELAVGDLSVGKTMRRLGEAFYGRGQALQAAFEALPDKAQLRALVERTLLAGKAETGPDALADYLIAARERLAAEPSERLVAGEIDWPTLAPVRAGLAS